MHQISRLEAAANHLLLIYFSWGEELEESDPLSIVPSAVSVGKEPSSSVSPRWVVERVRGFYKVVGLSCDRFEDKLMALFEEIEATRDQSIAKTMSMVTSTSGLKGQRERKWCREINRMNKQGFKKKKTQK
jgi:hypothetical protein